MQSRCPEIEIDVHIASVLHDWNQPDKEENKSSVLLRGPWDCLFVHSIYIPSIQSSHSSHSLIGDSTRMSGFNPTKKNKKLKWPTVYCLLAKVTRQRSRRGAPVYAAKATEQQMHENCAACILSCVYLYRSSYPCTKFTLVSWDRARGRASLCMDSLDSQIRGRLPEIDLLSLSISRKLWLTFLRLRVKSVKVKLELN